MKKIFIYLKSEHTWYGKNDENTNYIEDDNLIIFKEFDEIEYENNWITIINYKTRIKEHLDLKDIVKIVIH